MTSLPAGAVGTVRELDATPTAVFAAFADAGTLAAWWGPAGFSNSFETFEFKPGGAWVYTMHGPDGKNYPNESVFKEIVPGEKIVIEHVVTPRYLLTITLTPRGDKTRLTWTQAFEKDALPEKFRAFIEQANEQNLDKLAAVLAGGLRPVADAPAAGEGIGLAGKIIQRGG